MMVTEKEIIRQINQVISILANEGKVISYNSPIVKKQGHDIVITWSGAPSSLSDTYPPSFSNVSAYYLLISNSHYHILLRDGAVLQFSYLLSSSSELIRHRLVYYPCPISLEEDLVTDADDIAQLVILSMEEESQHLSSILAHNCFDDYRSLVAHKTPLRFDYDSEHRSQDPVHPKAHLHINQPNARWALAGPLTPLMFFRFIVKTFYPNFWEKAKNFTDTSGKLANFPKTIVSEPEKIHAMDLFIDWQ